MEAKGGGRRVNDNLGGASWHIFGCIFAIVFALIFHRYNETMIAENSHPRADDVLIVSYPKSGNTWMRFLISNLLAYNENEVKERFNYINFQDVENIIPDLEFYPHRELYRQRRAQEGLQFRFYKSHQPFTHTMARCDEAIGMMAADQCSCPNCPSEFRRIIYIVRDGRDVMCSYYKFRKNLGVLSKDTSFTEFMDSPVFPGYSWVDHVESYLNASSSDVLWSGEDGTKKPKLDIKFVHYEELLQFPTAILSSVAEWAGIPHSAESIEWAVSRSSFDALREVEDADGVALFQKRFAERMSPDWRFMRRGEAGSWGECFQESDADITSSSKSSGGGAAAGTTNGVYFDESGREGALLKKLGLLVEGSTPTVSD